jgi:hypothetical protein
MLGSFRFDCLLNYLKEGKFHEIYEKQYLQPAVEPETVIQFKSIENKHTHLTDQKDTIKNKKYEFYFHHDFLYMRENKEILNYDYIVNEYRLKIHNTLQTFKNNKPLLFINFIWDHEYMKSIIPSKINEMKDVLRKYIPHKPFYLLFFTSDHSYHFSEENVYLIKLDHYYSDWHMKTPKQNFELYKEIYTRFYQITQMLNLHHSFPLFENTAYYHTNK